MSSTETYFVAATTVTSGPTSALIRSYRSRTSSGDKADHPLPAREALVPAVGEEELRPARRAEIHPLDPRACRPQRALRRRPQVDVAATDDVAAEAAHERLRHLRTDLVAAWSDSRTDDGDDVAADRCNRRLEDPVEEASPAGVGNRERGVAAVDPCDGHGQAVCAELQHRLSRHVAPEPVSGDVDRKSTRLNSSH